MLLPCVRECLSHLPPDWGADPVPSFVLGLLPDVDSDSLICIALAIDGLHAAFNSQRTSGSYGPRSARRALAARLRAQVVRCAGARAVVRGVRGLGGES
eukprot:1824606-Pyramimonas_sp.AAC.1